MDLKKYLFRLTANHPDSWLSKGQELKRGADFMHGSNVQLYMLLMGFCFENLLKGILICDDLKKESKLTLKNWPGLSHNLLLLCKQCKFAINEREKNVLNRLTIFAVYRGRYPVPVEPKGYNEVRRHESGSIGADIYYGSDDPQTIKVIYERLEAKLKLNIRYLNKLQKTN